MNLRLPKQGWAATEDGGDSVADWPLQPRLSMIDAPKQGGRPAAEGIDY